MDGISLEAQSLVVVQKKHRAMCAFLPVCLADADVNLLAGLAICIIGLLIWETVWGSRKRRKRMERIERERKRRNHWGHA